MSTTDIIVVTLWVSLFVYGAGSFALDIYDAYFKKRP